MPASYPGAGTTWSNYYLHPQIVQSNVPAPFTLVNNFRGGIVGVSPTHGNSGGVSGNAWDSVTVGSGGTVQYSSTYSIHGLPFSILTQTTTANSSALNWTASVPQIQYQVWFCTYLLFPSLPASATRFYTTSQAGGAGGTSRFQVNTAGTITVQNSAGTNLTTTANIIPLGQWFRVEGYTTSSQGNGLTEVKLFANLDDIVPLETNTSALTNTGPGINGVLFGPNAGVANQGPFYIGYTAATNIGYMGPASLPNFIPQLEAFPGQQWQKKYQHRQVTYLTTPDINIGPPAQNVNVSAQFPDETVTIYQTFAQPFPESPILPSFLTFNPAFTSLRVQYNTALPNVFVPGAVSGVTVSAQFADEFVTEAIPGNVAAVSVSSPAGSITEAIPGAVSAATVSAPTGGMIVAVTASPANVSAGSASDNVISISVSAPSNVNVAAPPGTALVPSTINGMTANITVAAPPGTLTFGPTIRPDWWRVYRGYAQYPVW